MSKTNEENPSCDELDLVITAAEAGLIFEGLRPQAVIQWNYRGLIKEVRRVGRSPLFRLSDVGKLYESKRNRFRPRTDNQPPNYEV